MPRAAEGVGASSSSMAADDTPTGTETVLIVEDADAMLELGRSMLARLGYKVLTARSPSEAIQLATEHAGLIHLLITDVVMPDMNGKELAARLTAITPALKCLFMSGYTADIISRHGVLQDAVHFVEKPFSMSALAQGIRKALT
jgi:two-component system cell cycle sensor histidine kinase/response regulator CckA